MNGVICQAINDLRLISFTYEGYPRTVEPHTYGENHKGNVALRAYQVRGGSESGEFQGWKIFLRDEMQFLTVLEESFPHARREYKRRDKAFARIFCEL